MAAAAVAKPLAATEAMQVDAAARAEEEDLYSRLKALQRQLEFLDIQVGVS